jgi:hypothetical protein
VRARNIAPERVTEIATGISAIGSDADLLELQTVPLVAPRAANLCGRPGLCTSMRATTIRFSAELWTVLEREARREGVSVAQYVRDAALFRVAYGMGERSDRFRRLPEEVREELERAAPGARKPS